MYKLLLTSFDNIDRELLLTCFSRGGYSLIRQWLIQDLPKTSSEIASLVYEVATNGWIVQKKTIEQTDEAAQ